MKITLNDDFNNCLFLHFLNLSFISLDTCVYHSKYNNEHTCIILKKLQKENYLTLYMCICMRGTVYAEVDNHLDLSYE